MNVLVLNAGSNSLKFDVVAASASDDAAFSPALVSGSYDNIGKPSAAFSLLEHKQPKHKEDMPIRDHGHATELLFAWLAGGAAAEQGIRNLADIERIGHRVVHGADYFKAPAVVNDQVIRQIEDLQDLAPLHNVSALKVIRAAQAASQGEQPMVAVFDTTFHQTIPERAALYGLPLVLAQRHKIRRYGFHGISHRYLMLRYAQIAGRPASELNLITLHLEGGSSVAAIRHGQSIDTSMGFTPLEGLMMGTRCGDLDPAILPYLMRKENMDPERLEQFLNKECGLLGVSGMSADTRELRTHLSEHAVNLAFDIFAYRVTKYVGAYLAALGGADAIVVGGGIGENTAVIRERAFENFGWCGATFDRERNQAADDRECPITTPDSKLPIWVVPTEEGLMIANEVAGCSI